MLQKYPSMDVPFNEFPPLKKSSVTLTTFSSNKKSGSEKREKISFFCKLNIKDQCFLHSSTYSDNKNTYMFVKNVK